MGIFGYEKQFVIDWFLIMVLDDIFLCSTLELYIAKIVDVVYFEQYNIKLFAIEDMASTIAPESRCITVDLL